MEISVERYHYPVGQGIFSAQIIRADEERYVCVYDCGSASGKRNIPMYANELYEKLEPDKINKKGKKTIDLLVISHLDRDHVNGVPELMEIFNVRKIVIPYMSKIEKIIFAWTELNAGDELFQRGALNAHSLLAGLISEVRDDGTELNLDLGPTEVVESSAVASTEYLEINRNMSKVPQDFSQIWEFLHFSLFSGKNDSIKNDFIKEFDKGFRGILGKGIDDLAIEDLQDTKKREKIKGVYDSVCKRVENMHKIELKDIFNASSIILYSGPASDLQKLDKDSLNIVRESTGQQVVGGYEAPVVYHREKFSHSSCSNNLECIGGWLGTGDALLKESANIHELKANLGEERINRVQVLTAPHHGSRKNSDYEFYDVFSQNGIECIVQSNPEYTHRHPHADVKEVITRMGFVEIPVTKEEESFYREYLHLDVGEGKNRSDADNSISTDFSGTVRARRDTYNGICCRARGTAPGEMMALIRVMREKGQTT